MNLSEGFWVHCTGLCNFSVVKNNSKEKLGEISKKKKTLKNKHLNKIIKHKVKNNSKRMEEKINSELGNLSVKQNLIELWISCIYVYLFVFCLVAKLCPTLLRPHGL